MRTFSYRELPVSLLTNKVMNLVAAIHEHRGRQELYLNAHADELSVLCDIARIQSTEASNNIEGIKTTSNRIKELMVEKTTPRSRDEEEIAGYRDVLALIHEEHDYVDPTPSVILQLHKILYARCASARSIGGFYKIGDNVIAELDENGNQRVRFRPTPAVCTPDAVDSACAALRDALENGDCDHLLVICMFLFDFICIHPFSDGNGRMSRLLTLLLLYRSGYLVGKYVSIEKLIDSSKQSYYEALRWSSEGWDTGNCDYEPFVSYMLGVILAVYREFEGRVQGLVFSTESKPARIERLFDTKLGRVTKADILNEYPDISMTTVERTLAELLSAGKIVKVGAGRSTAYVKRG